MENEKTGAFLRMKATELLRKLVKCILSLGQDKVKNFFKKKFKNK